jgi:hypothetical protein
MPTPSLLIVPSRWKTGSPGKLYSQIPTNGNGDFNVTGVVTGGTSIGTRVNNIGYIEPITTSGTPRLDYYTSSGVPGCPALLVEPSGTNLALQSEAFNTTWTISNSTQITTNTTGTTDPAGSTLSDLIFCQASGSAAQGVTQAISIATSGTYTMSVFVKKAANFDWFRIQFQDPAAATHQVYYNLASGTLGAVDAGSTGTITNFGNGWYRVTHSRSTASGSISFGLRLANANSSLVVPCDGISGAFVFGAQLETGSVATSYIPTTTGTVTRNADVISVSGAVSGSIGQTEGVLYIECESNDGLDDVFFINRSTVNGLVIYKNANNAYLGRIHHSSATITFQSGNNVSGMVKIAIAYKSGDSTMYLNGSQVGTLKTDAITFSAALNSVGVNKSPFFSGAKPSRIRAAALYTTRLTNADLMLLTMPGNNTYLPQAVWDNYLSRTGNSEVPDCLYTRHADLLDV